MKLYVHDAGSAEVNEIEDVLLSRTVGDVVDIVQGDFLFIDESDHPVDLQLTIVEVTQEGRAHHHIHRHPCRSLEIGIQYTGRRQVLRSGPGALVESLLLRAVSLFGIDPVTGADLVLRLRGSDSDLSASTPAGSLAPRGHCHIDLNMVPGLREQG